MMSKAVGVTNPRPQLMMSKAVGVYLPADTAADQDPMSNTAGVTHPRTQLLIWPYEEHCRGYQPADAAVTQAL